MKNEFKCLKCGACCRWQGYVIISEKESDEISAFLGVDTRIFLEKYTVLTKNRSSLSISEKEDGSCVLFDNELSMCRIYPVRPAQCRNFPHIWNFEGWNRLCAAGKDMPSNMAH